MDTYKPNLTTLLRVAAIVLLLLVGVFSLAQDVVIGPTDLEVGVCGNGTFTITLSTTTDVNDIVVEAWVAENLSNDDILATDFTFVGATGTADTSFKITWPTFNQLSTDPDWANSITVSPTCAALSNRVLVVEVRYSDGGSGTITERYYSGSIQTLMPNLVVELSPEAIYNGVAGGTASWEVWVENTGLGVLSGAEVEAALPATPGGIDDLTFAPWDGSAYGAAYSLVAPILVPDLDPNERVLLGLVSGHITAGTTASCENIYVTFTGTFGCEGVNCQPPVVVTGSVALQYRTPNLVYSFTPDPITSIPFCDGMDVTVTVQNVGPDAGNIVGLEMVMDAYGVTFTPVSDTSATIDVIYDGGTNTFSFVEAANHSNPAIIASGVTLDFVFNVSLIGCGEVHCTSLIFQPHFNDDCGDDFYATIQELKVSNVPPIRSDYDIDITQVSPGPTQILNDGQALVYEIETTYHNLQPGETQATAYIAVTIPAGFTVSISGTSTGYTLIGNTLTWPAENYNTGNGWTVDKDLELTAHYAGHSCEENYTVGFAVVPTVGMCETVCLPDGATANMNILGDTAVAVAKSVTGGADGIVYAGDELTYTVGVSYYGPLFDLDSDSSVDDTPPVVVTDTIPAGMEYVAGTGYVDGLLSPPAVSGNGTTATPYVLTWCLPENRLVQGGQVPIEYEITAITNTSAPGYDECLCGAEIANTATATLVTSGGGTGCTPAHYSPFTCDDGATLTLAYNCEYDTGFTATKEAVPDSAELCDYETGMTIRNTVVFVSEIDDWNDVTFTENGHGTTMVFHDPADPTPLTGTADFYLNGTLVVNDYPITIGAPLALGSTGANLPLPGTPGSNDTLEIVYKLYFTSDAGTTAFADWSDITVEGLNPNPDCPDTAFHVSDWVTPLSVAPTIGIAEFCHYDLSDDECTYVVNRCDTATFRIYLTSERIERNVSVVVDLMGNYTYETSGGTINGTVYHNISSAGGTLPTHATIVGGTLVWNLGDLNVMPGSDNYLQFDLTTDCEGGTSVSADVSAKGWCGTNTYTRSETYEASRAARNVDLLIKKTPDVIYVKDRGTQLNWTIYVTNPDSGTATNVNVIDTLGGGISYVSSAIDGVAVTDSYPYTPPNPYPNPTIITWNVPEIEPGQTVVITITGKLESCDDRTNYVEATWGCLDEAGVNLYCDKVEGPTVIVQDLNTRVIITTHDADDINTCGGPSWVTVKFRNIGKAYAYNMVLTEDLPDGVLPTGAWSIIRNGNVADDISSHFTFNPTAVTWTADDEISMKPVDNSGLGDEFTLVFGVQMNGCSYLGGDKTMTANLGYETPCTTSTSPAQDGVSTVSAPVLIVTKSPNDVAGDPSDPITWNISIYNPSVYSAQSVILWDDPPPFFASVTLFPSMPGNGVSEADPWHLGTILPGETMEFSAMGTLTGCGDGSTGVNTAWVRWCEDCWTSASSNVSSIFTIPNIGLDVETDLDYCGGEVAIEVINGGSRAYNVVLTDTLPDGFKYSSVTSATITSNLTGRTFSVTAPVITGDGTSGNPFILTWDSGNFGTYIEKFETLTITFYLENEIGSGAVPCVTSFGPSNYVYVTYYDDCSPLPYNASSTDAISIPTVPDLDVTKVLTGPVVIGEEDEGIWHVTITSNDGAANGTITIVDTLGTGWNVSEATVTAPTTISGTGTRTIVGDPVNGGGTVTWSGVSLDADETVEFDISVQAMSTGPEAQLTNEITVTGACIGGCTYSSATATSTTIPGHTEITKVITDNTPADSTTTATIGETVQVRIRAEYYGSSTNYTGVTVWDTPPTGLILGTPTVTYGGAVPSVTPSGTPMLWNVADFIGYGWVQIDYSATVDNTTDIGTDTGETSVLPNTAYTHYTTGTGTYTDSAAASLTVLEPRLVIEKNDNVGAVVSAGDDIHYTVSVHHPSSSVPGDTTAHDIIVTDTVPDELVMPSTVTVSTGSTSIVGRVITWTIPSLATTDPIATLQYDTTVIDTVEPGDAFKNTATLTWTSLAGNVPGERIGTGGLEYNDYHAETEIPLTVDNSADITKTRDKAIATIGETVTYTITVDLPIAQIPSLTIEDTLHAGYDYTEGETTITLPNGTTITGAAADPTGTNPYTWSFTNIEVDAGHTDDDLVITFEAVVTNIAGNQGEAPATTLTNSVTATSAKLVFVGSPTPGVDTATAPLVTVVEPRLTIVKTHARVSGPTDYQVGTVVEYTLTITNTGGCTAYDVDVRDTFDTRFINPAYNPASAPAGVTYGTPGNPMTWTVASIAGNGGSIALRYRVTIGNTADVNPGDILNNTAETIWQSLPDSFTEHRYGAYGAVPADLNNYYATDDDSITIYDTARVYKCFEGQAYNANTSINVTVGSPASYTITVTLPRATIPDLTITDTLPVGVRYVAGSAVINAPYGTNSPYAPLNPEPVLSPATPNDGTVATTLTWTYANVNATAGTALTITFDVVVTNHLINQNTRVIGNTVIATGTTLDFSSAAGDQRTGSDASGNMNVREPVLTLTKEDVFGTGNLYEAGKVIQYRLTLTNTGTSTAYDINIEDTLPVEFISPAYIPATAPAGVTYGAAGSPMTWTIDSLAAGATMTLEYQITIADGVIAGTEYTNTARMIWQSLDDSFSDHRYGIYGTTGGLNDYFTSDTYPITIDDSANITKTRDKDEATIGETVTYTITVDLPIAYIPSLSIEDTLDAGYDYVEGETTITLPDGTTITGAAADPSGANPYTWSFTNIAVDAGHTNDDLVITFEAVVLNIMGNQAGNTLTNVATATAATLVFAGGTTATAPVVTVIEPVLEIEKNDDDADSIVDAGQPIHYTVSVHHPALSVANDTTAYDIIITDTVPVELEMPLEAALVVSVGSATISGRVITWTIPSLTTGASTATLEYDTTVVDTVEPGDVFKNEALLTWTSLHDSTPGEYPERRIGTGALPQNDYHNNTDLTLTVDNSADLTKTRDKANATIGETVTYTITVDLPMAQIPSLSIVDTLDAGYDYTEGETTITLPNGTTITGGSADPSGANPYTWSFTNIAVDAGHTDDDLVITFEAVVRNIIGNQDTVDLANEVTATAATLAFVGSPTPGAETVTAELVNIVEPVLTLTKSHVLGSGTLYESGRVVRYTLTLTNTGTSTAYDINIEDTLPAEFINPTYISGDDDSYDFTGNPLTWHINSLAVNATATLVYEITIADGAIAGAEYTNTAVTVWQSLEDTYPQRRDGTDGVGGLNDYTTSDTNSITIDNSADIQKTTDNERDVTIGLTVPYTITIDLPMAEVEALTVTDALEPGLAYVPNTVAAPLSTTITLPNGTVISGTAANPSAAAPLTWNFTDIAVDPGHTDDDIVITFHVLVTTDAVNVDLRHIPNEATATSVNLDFDSGTSGNQNTETDSSGDLIVHVPAFTIEKTIASIAYCDSTGHATDFVEPGDIVTYTITVHNVGSAGGTAFGVMVQDDLPPEFEYIAGTTVISTGATTDPDTSVAHRCVWSVGDMAGATDLTITFNARVTSDIDKTIERYRNSAYVWGYYDTAHALPIEADNHERVGADDNATDTAFADITGTRLPEITVEKSVLSVSGPNAETVQPGDWATYRIVVTNTGDGAAYDIDVTDVLPVGLVYANVGSTTTADWTGGYAGSHTDGPTGTITGDPAGVTGTITWDGADILGDPRGIVLTPDAVLTLDYRVYVTEDIIQGEELVNNATIYGGDCNGARTLMVTDDSTIHTHEPFFVTDKTITQIDGDPTNITVAVVGSIIDYSYTITNVGLGDANTITVYDTLPIGFVYVPLSANIGEPTTISADGRDLTWETGDSIASGTTYTVTFQAQVTDGTSGGTMYNLMWVTGLDGSGHAVVRDGSLIIPADTDADDTDEVPVEVDIPNKPLILNKDVTPRAVDPGAVVHYTVTFTNKRKISFYEATITDTMPHGFRYLPGTTLINGVPAADPTGDNPYVFTIGTVGPESTTRLDYYVLVSHAARHGANVNVAVLNAHDGAGKPISLTDRATVTVKGGGFFDFDIPIPPRKPKPGVIPERPLPPKEEERPCPECCLHVALVPIRSQAFGDTLPGQPEIYYQTDIAMYAATELLVTERRLIPWIEVQGFDPEREYLMTGLYNRMITKLGEYAQYNLGNVVMESMLGIPLSYAPGILETAKRDRISPERAGENLIASLAKRAGLSQAPEIQPIFLEYFGSYPYLHDRIAKDELAWEENLMDKNIMPAALGFTLLREANQIETFLASTDPTERFFGLLLLTQAVEKTASISTDLAKTAEFSPPVKYLPHFSRIEVDKGRPGLVWRTTDETSTLYDHVSVLWGLSKLRSVTLHSADPDVRALLPQITERMDEVYRAIEAIHYNQKDKTFISVHAPGAAETENKIAAKDLAFTILALRSVLFDNRDLSINTIDPQRKIIEIADFMIEELTGDDGGIYTAYNYADGTPVVGVKRTLVDNSLAIRALLSAYVVTEDRKYRKAALDVYAFMVKELWREDLMIFIDEEDPDYEVVLTPQSIGALIGALRDLVLYGEPDMRHEYLDRMSYTTDRILDQSQLQLYENRFFPWHAPITIVPEEPNGRSYIKPIIATMRDKGISHDLAPILVRKMVLNITPAGAIASGKEDPVSDWKNWPADLRYEVPDVIASSLIDDTFVTDEGMYFTTLTRDYRMNLDKNLPAFNPYNTDPGIQVYAAFVGEEVSRYNVENLTLNSEMGIGLSKSELVRTLAEKARKSPEKYLTEFVQKRVPKEAAATGIFDRFIDSVKGAVGLDRNGRFADIIFLEYASGKPFYAEDISDGWNEETFDKKLTVSSMSSTMVRQLLVILDSSRRNDLTTSERFVDDVMTLSVAAKRVALDEIISKAEKGGVKGVPHSFKMVADEKKKRDVIEIVDKKSSLFDDTFAVWAMALFIDARRQGLFDAYRGAMGDPSNDQETLSGLIDALIAHHYSVEYGTLVTGSVNTVDVSKALDMLTRAVEVMEDGPAKDTLTGLIKKQADFIMTRLPNDTGFAPMVGLGNETIAADLCEMETLGTNVFPILALVRTSEVTGDEKYLRAALTFFDRFDQSKWDQAIGLYLSSGTIYKATDRSRLELKYNNQELIAAVLLISKLQPHLAGERKILSAYHMTTFMNRIMEIASVQRYPGNGDPPGTIFSPEIIRSVKIILEESKGVGKPGDVFTNRIVIDNDCYDQFCNDQIDRAPSRIRIEETLPDGFHYVPGSTRFNGAPGSEPIGTKTLNWYYSALSGGNRLIIDYQVVADPGISEGSYTTSLNVSGFSGYGGQDTICDVRGITATTVIMKDLFAEDVEKSCVPCNIGRRALSR